MSVREVDIAIRQINRRRHNDIAIQASLHGVKMEMIEIDYGADLVEFDESKDEAAKKAMAMAVEGLMKEYGRHKSDN